MLDYLQQIVVLAAVAQEQHFTRAADRLGISKSQVSKQVRYLEDRLGVQLVQRNTRSVSLTEVGSRYAEYGSQLIATLDEAEAMVAGYRNEVTGKLKIGVAQSFGNTLMTRHFAKFRQTYPALNLNINLFDHRPNLVEEGYDCWVAIHEHPPEGMVARKLADCQFKLVAAPGYLEARGIPKQLVDLRQHDCITYQSRERRYDKWPFMKAGMEQVVHVSGQYTINNAPAVLEAVKAGLGIAYLATYLINEEIEKGELIELLPEWQPCLELPIYIVYPRRKHLAPKVREFVDFMLQEVGDPPIWDRHHE
ncbi:LysR family transcriptional regulator [Salinivibrio kushneri]|uniref:LysR family transcriptional regulator n=2 Tax=Salinivibrio TaxID=51366 RepID=A0AB36JW07_9GAMM|nr:LysR family transcriptional regulator [Salinivibrio kushneri]OOE39852.1 LysR family transcriptional regulator [Salinivibrio kushneri]QCP03437.1 LysR family transcriptional regulator [Salinivibrio kushneri]